MNSVELSFNEIAPNVRFVKQVICPPCYLDKKRKVYDHMFAYVHKGGGIIEIGNNSYKASLMKMRQDNRSLPHK